MSDTMKRPRKSNAERARAKYLRGKQKQGKKLTPPERVWLDSYERETARWVRGRWERDHEDLTRREAAGEFAVPPGPLRPIDLRSPAVPMHTAPPVEGGGGPERFTALPMLPPAAGPGSSSPVAESGAAAVTAESGAAGGASPAGGSPSSGGGPEPLIDAPAAAPDPAVLEAGAERFAALVVAINTFGLAALLELVPEGSLPLPPSIEAAVRSKEAHQALLGGLHAAAVELARAHPWLCAAGPSPALVVIGSTGISLTALWLRHVRPMLSPADAVEVGPGQVERAPAESPANGSRRPVPSPAPGGLDFATVLR